VGLLSRLLNGSSRAATAQPAQQGRGVQWATVYGGNEPLEVVGESRYQGALWEIVGGVRSERVREAIVAVLMPEPTNPYDPDAIQVLVSGHVVGYLSREDAAAYRPGLLHLMESNDNGFVALNGVIAGGGQRSDGLGRLGVFLQHHPSDFGLRPPTATPPPRLRTGFSEAVATDIADDRYDLSWFEELSNNDVTAITQLRRHLEAETDPIDRHYMLCELEKRLYRSRNAFGSALDEYDAICRQHDTEMTAIRPALLEKFGSLPVLDTYRQAAIRCQKAKDWATMRTWIERGLEMYGDDAARPEAVEDLRKRFEYAVTKIDAANRTRAPQPAGARDSSTMKAERDVETLVCSECGKTFERIRTRGRKPHACPSCRSV
jgi:rubrerythrin